MVTLLPSQENAASKRPRRRRHTIKHLPDDKRGLRLNVSCAYTVEQEKKGSWRSSDIFDWELLGTLGSSQTSGFCVSERCKNKENVEMS